MLLSQTTRYALQAAVLLAERHDADVAVSVAEMAQVLDIPRNYLSKTLHQLARNGILTSERGPKGGFRLATAPDRIRLAEIVEPVEPGFSERHCLLGRATCSDDDPCPAHGEWREVSGKFTRFLEETSLAQLVRDD